MELTFRKAQRTDLEAIIKMLSNDILGKERENFKIPLPQYYIDAFNEIDKSDNNLLVVATLSNNEVIGTMQLTFIPNLSSKGAKRLLIEAVRIDNKYCNQGIGSQMIKWAIEKGKEEGCQVAQLTTNKIRKRAHNFYKKLGFKDTHLGMKLNLSHE